MGAGAVLLRSTLFSHCFLEDLIRRGTTSGSADGMQRRAVAGWHSIVACAPGVALPAPRAFFKSPLYILLPHCRLQPFVFF